MLYQISFDDYAWVIGLGVMFGLSLLFNTILDGDYKTFILLLLGFNGIVVLAGLLESWTLILIVIFVVILLVKESKGVDI